MATTSYIVTTARPVNAAERQNLGLVDDADARIIYLVAAEPEDSLSVMFDENHVWLIVGEDIFWSICKEPKLMAEELVSQLARGTTPADSVAVWGMELF